MSSYKWLSGLVFAMLTTGVYGNNLISQFVVNRSSLPYAGISWDDLSQIGFQNSSQPSLVTRFSVMPNPDYYSIDVSTLPEDSYIISTLESARIMQRVGRQYTIKSKFDPKTGAYTTVLESGQDNLPIPDAAMNYSVHNSTP